MAARRTLRSDGTAAGDSLAGTAGGRLLPAALFLALLLLSAWAQALAQDRSDPADPADTGPAAALAREIADLEALVAGALPRHSPLPALFEIDVRDAQAVARRIAELQARLATPAPAPPADRAADAAAESDGTETPPESGPPAEAPSTQAAEAATEAALQERRDRLRLQFLQLPEELRARLIEDDRLRREQQAALERQAQAAAALAAAERERQAALAAARAAASAMERALAIEAARLQAQKARLAALEQAWSERQQAQLARQSELRSRYAPAAEPRRLAAEPAFALFQSLRADQRDVRQRAEDALARLYAGSEVPEPPFWDPSALPAGVPPAALTPLATLAAELEAAAAQLRHRESQLRFEDAQQWMRVLQLLQGYRLALFERLTPEQRARVSGWNAEGWSRVRSELAQLLLMARWYPVEREHQIEALPTLLRDVFTAGRLGLKAAALLLLVVIYWQLRRRAPGLLSRLRAAVLPQIASRVLALRLQALILGLQAVLPELLFLAFVHLLFDRLLSAPQLGPELATLRRLAYALAWYRLGLAAVHRLFLNAARRHRRVDPALNDKIHRSVRLVARFALGLRVYLILSQALLGRGALYAIAVEIAWAGAAVIAWRLLRAWRGEVTGSYLKLFPEGRLARAVRDSAERPYGLFVALIAFSAVAVRGVLTWLRDTALGFEQTRRALAYLLRRRLERQAERRSGAPPDPAALPEDLAAALTENPLDAATLAQLGVPRFPQLERVLDWSRRLQQGEGGGLVALVGETGSGKTSWLRSCLAQLPPDQPANLLTLHERLLDPGLLQSALQAHLAMPGLSPAAFTQALRQGPPRVLLLDDAQLLMLRAVGGQSAHDWLLEQMRQTRERVLWVLAFGRWPFEFLQRLSPHSQVYDHIIRLDGWSETDINALIETRMAAAGYEADYSGLRLDSAPRPRETGGDAELEPDRPSDRYHRVIWHYADGNPRVALYYWRHSLRPAGARRVQVQLFATPPVARLELLPLRVQFLLAAVLQHERLSPAHAARTLRHSESECRASLERLVADGILEPDRAGFAVSTRWQRAVLRFLQRKRLLLV